jgi:hypothetical protein
MLHPPDISLALRKSIILMIENDILHHFILNNRTVLQKRQAFLLLYCFPARGDLNHEEIYSLDGFNPWKDTNHSSSSG